MTQTRYDHLINSHRGLGAATLRDIIIPALLGTETEGILYWIGKDLAREYPVATEEELIVLTNQLGMGELSLKKRSATQQIWELGGPIVDERLTLDKETTSFALEAGFLAHGPFNGGGRTSYFFFFRPNKPVRFLDVGSSVVGIWGWMNSTSSVRSESEVSWGSF